MHLIKSALLLILFACLPFSASAAPVAVAKNPLAATTPATTVSPGEQVNINTVDAAALIRGSTVSARPRPGRSSSIVRPMVRSSRWINCWK